MRNLLIKFGLSSLLVSLVACSSMPTMLGGGDEFKLRPYRELTLKNGLKVLLVEDRSLPSFSLTMLVKTGASSDPKGNSGLASMVAELVDKGTTKRSTEAIADSLGQIGASFSGSAGSDFTTFSSGALSFNQDQLMTDFAEILLEPSFTESEVTRIRKETLASIQRLVDEPDDFAGVMFLSWVFQEHPYARPAMGQRKDISAIRRKDIIKFYKQHYRPNNAMLAVTGRFDKDIEKRLEEKFGSWSAREVDVLQFPKVPAIESTQVKIIDKADLKQSQIRIGHIGIRRDDPDFLPLRVANTILGGAFRSRLMDEIREKRGLTYSIGSSFDARRDPGPFLVSTFTRHEKVGETVRETMRILKEFHDRGVSEEEVKEATAYLKGVFPQSLETPEALAYNLLVLRYYGIKDSYLTSYLREMGRISASDVNRVVKAHLRPEKLKILVFSSSKQILGQVKEIAPVDVKSYRDFL